jgi:hypothetical protein
MTQGLRMAVKAAIFCCMLLGGLAPALALTLGSLQGAVWIGRSMDVALALYAEAGEDMAALCLEADVFYADTRQDPRGVSLSFKAGLPGQPAMLRIASAPLVDEPMVTLHVRAGCVHKTSRRYVLLADPPLDLPAPAPAPPLAASPPAPPAPPAAFASASEPSPPAASTTAAPTIAAPALAAPVKLAEPGKAEKRAKAGKKGKKSKKDKAAKPAKPAKPARVGEAGKPAKVGAAALAKP